MESWTVITKTENGVDSWEQKPYYKSEGKPEWTRQEKPEWYKNVEGGKPEWYKNVEGKPEWYKNVEGGKPEWYKNVEGGKPEWYKNVEGKPEWARQQEKPEWSQWESKPEWARQQEKPEWSQWESKPEWARQEKPEWCQYETKPEWTRQEKPEWCQYETKPEWNKNLECCKPEWYKNVEGKPEWARQQEKPEWCQWESKPEWSQWESKPEWTKTVEGKREWIKRQEGKPEHIKWGKKPWYTLEVCGDWEKICHGLERVQLEQPYGGRYYEQKPRWSCKGQGCCDEEMIKQVKGLITILVGAEQSYEQLGFLCMDERFTLTNTSEYFRLCGLRMRWLANGLIRRSNRLFNVHEWINNTNFENWFKVPTKEELSTNDYTGVMKTLFKIVIDAEKRLVEKMEILGEKMVKSDWMNTECRFDGFKWFVNFVLPYQTNFLREIIKHWHTIEMCNNGYIFDKCEMYPLVVKIEEFIHNLVKLNEIKPNMPMIQRRNW